MRRYVLAVLFEIVSHRFCRDFTSFLDPVYGMCYQFNNYAEPKFFGEDAGPERGA